MSVCTRPIVAIVALALASCMSTAPTPAPVASEVAQAAVAPMRETTAMTDLVATGRPTHVVVFVELEGTTVTTTPETIYVDTPAQTVLWVSNAKDIQIVYKDMPNKPPAPRCINGKGRCATTLPNRRRGEVLEYTARAFDEKGNPHDLDPRIIIHYDQ